jgi:hypothetical protein
LTLHQNSHPPCPIRPAPFESKACKALQRYPAPFRMVALTAQMIKGKTRLESLEDVRNLNLWGQDLDDISLLQSLGKVEILSFSVNRIGE